MSKGMCNIPDDILEKLQKDISEIKVALLGNEYNPEGGLLYRMKEAEHYQLCLNEKISKLEDRLNKVFWTAAGGAAVITALLTLIFNLRDIIALFNAPNL